MNAIAPPLSRAYLSDQLADLAEIYQPSINLCVITRHVDAELKSFVEQLLANTKNLNFVETITFASFDFFNLLPQAKKLTGHHAFCADVAQLTALYCDLFDLKRAGLRLHLLNHAMCPRFHVDSVTCRLVCTYGDRGTEWLENAYGDRRKLGRGAAGLSDDKSGLILDADAIQHMPAYALGLLKGSAWAGNEQQGAIHRSPQVTDTNARRLLLTLDFA